MQERSRVLRRRLRELTDRGLALGSVHGRFGKDALEAAPAPGPASTESRPASAAPLPPAAVSAPSFTLAPPAPRPEESHEKLLAALAARHEDGFTVGQMKAVMEELDGRTRSYDAAWALANRLERARVLELAGSRPGPAGPIRVFRVPRATAASPEVR